MSPGIDSVPLQVTVVATVMGMYVALSSLLFTHVVMTARGSDFIARVRRPLCPIIVAIAMPASDFHACTGQVVSPSPRNINANLACDSVRYVSWGELLTMIYLQLSLADFLTLYCARCLSW